MRDARLLITALVTRVTWFERAYGTDVWLVWLFQHTPDVSLIRHNRLVLTERGRGTRLRFAQQSYFFPARLP